MILTQSRNNFTNVSSNDKLPKPTPRIIFSSSKQTQDVLTDSVKRLIEKFKL